jgi:hypothetical protein
VSDQGSGTSSSLYVNGELAAKGTHDHEGDKLAFNPDQELIPVAHRFELGWLQAWVRLRSRTSRSTRACAA